MHIYAIDTQYNNNVTVDAHLRHPYLTERERKHAYQNDTALNDAEAPAPRASC